MANAKVLLITGASSGIGAATARAAAEDGWSLVLAARSARQTQGPWSRRLAKDRACAVPCDVTDYRDQQRMVDVAINRFGHIDAVFANAGIGGEPGGFSGAPPEEKLAQDGGRQYPGRCLHAQSGAGTCEEGARARADHRLRCGTAGAGRVHVRGNQMGRLRHWLRLERRTARERRPA